MCNNQSVLMQSDTRQSEGLQNQLEDYGLARSSFEKRTVMVNIQQQRDSSAESSKSNVFKNQIGNRGIQLTTRSKIKDTVVGEKFAVDMLQTYWPYLQGFTATAENSQAPNAASIDTQRRPHTQQKSNHVPLKQFPVAEGVPFQLHQKLAGRRCTSKQLKAWSKPVSRSRTGISISPLGKNIIKNSQPITSCVLGKRLCQKGVNTKIQDNKSLNLIKVARLLTKEEESIRQLERDSRLCKLGPFQQRISDDALPSPSRGSTHRNSSSFLVPLNSDGSIDQEQLRAFQHALSSGLDGRNTNSRVIGIVGDFAPTLKEQCETRQSQNSGTKTILLSNPNQEESKTQVCVYTFGDSFDERMEIERKNKLQCVNHLNGSDDSQAEALLKYFRDEDDNHAILSSQNIVSQPKNSQLSQNECDCRQQTEKIEKPQCESVSMMVGRFYDGRNSPREQFTFYDERSRGDSLDTKNRQIQHPQKPQTSHGKSRFYIQTKEKSILSGTNVLDKQRSCDDEDKLSNYKHYDAKEIKTKQSKIAEAYMNYAMRLSSREYPKERLGSRLHVTQEQATETSMKINSELEHTSTLVDSVTFNSERQKKEGASQRCSPFRSNRHIEYPGNQLNKQNSLMEDLVQSSQAGGTQAQLENPPSMKISGSPTHAEERSNQNSHSIDTIDLKESDKYFLKNYRGPKKSDMYIPQKQLAASINKIYSYQARRPFNIQQLQNQAKKQTKIAASSQKKQQRQADKQSLQNELAKSFYSGLKTQEGNRIDSSKNKESLEQVVRNIFADSKQMQESNASNRQESFVTSFNDLSSVPSAIGYLPSSRLYRRLSSSDEILQDALLIIRGQLPSQTQHQSYLVKGRIDQPVRVAEKLKTGAQINDKQPQKDNNSPSTALSGNKDLSHMSVKLVKSNNKKKQYTTQSTTREPPNLIIGVSSMNSTLHTTQNQLNTNIQPMRNSIMQAQIVKTEGSADKLNSTSESPIKSKCVDDLKILSSIATQQGNSTIKALDDKNICFDQHSISTCLMRPADEDTPSYKHQSSVMACDGRNLLTGSKKNQTGFNNAGSFYENQ